MNETGRGWIKLWRSITDNHVLSDDDIPYNKRMAFIDLLLQTSYSNRKTVKYIRNVPVELKKGQIAISERELVTRWGPQTWTRNKVSGFLKRLEQEGMISINTNNLTTIITICKWNEYQEPYYKSSRSQPQPQPQTNHRNSETPVVVGFGEAKKGKEGNKKEELFEKFWYAYPVKQGKEAARIIWLSIGINDDLFSTIMSSLENQKKWKDWEVKGGQFIPKPEKWLLGKLWNDQPREQVKPDGDWSHALF